MRLILVIFCLFMLAPPLFADEKPDNATETLYRRFAEVVRDFAGNTGEVAAASAALAEARAVEIAGVKPPWWSGTEKPETAKRGDNYCGQYALATIFPYLGLDGDFDRIFRETNPGSIYTTPIHLEEYVRRRGGQCRGVNETTTDELKAQLDAGRPVAVLVRSGDSVTSLHWIAVTGYRNGSEGQTEWKVSDTVWGTGSRDGYVWMKDARFQERWNSYVDDGGLGDRTLAYKRYAVFFDRDPHILENTAAANEDALLGGSNDFVVGWKTKSWRPALAGLVEMGAGLFALPATLKGRFLQMAGHWLGDWGRKRCSRGGFLNGVLGWSARATGVIARVGGTLFDWVGRGISTLGNGLGKLIY